MTQPILTPWHLLTASGALLAFLVGLYTLVGRERKAPYLINSVFSIFGVCIAGIIVDILSLLFKQYESELLTVGIVFLLTAVAQTFWRLSKIAVRFSFFIDSIKPRYWKTFRFFKDTWRRVKGRPHYNYNATPIKEEFRTELVNLFKRGAQCGAKFDDHQDFNYRSGAIKLRHQGEANEILAELALAFLRKKYPVQYLTASRHPIEFISYLKQRAEETKDIDWKTVSNLVVVIDAYTPHFGFIDSIYSKATQGLKEDSVSYLPSGQSYAGLHHAASIAFNQIKDKIGGNVRHPSLVIYEDTYALTDLESPEQYRIFIRHVLPSERLWEGMFTIFAETIQSDNDWKLLSSYVSATLDFSVRDKTSTSAATAQTMNPSASAGGYTSPAAADTVPSRSGNPVTAPEVREKTTAGTP